MIDYRDKFKHDMLDKFERLSNDHRWSTERKLQIALEYITEHDCSSDFSDWLEYESEGESK